MHPFKVRKATQKMEEIKKQLDRIEQLTLLAAKTVLKTEEVAILTGLSESFIYKLTSQKKIPHYKKEGKILYFDKQEIEDWMKETRIATVQETEADAQRYLVRNGSRTATKRGGVR